MYQSERRRCGRLSFKLPPFPQVVDRLVRLIAGKELTDLRDMARYKRSLSGAEARNKAITAVRWESPPPIADENKRKTNFLERTVSIIGTTPPQGSVRPPGCVQQTVPDPVPEPEVWPQGAPDISCRELSAEQIARTYGKSCDWDMKTNPVPPMQEMEGFGRFRRSIHADADWQLNAYREDLQRLGPAIVHQLGDFEIAKLNKVVMDIIRTPSCPSLTSRSDSNCSADGPRVYRGFDNWRRPQPGSRCKRGSVSMLDMPVGASPGLHGDVVSKSRPRPTQVSFLRTDLGPPGQPRSVDETAAAQRRKRVVPLTFGPQAAPDEVIEDDDDDDEYESCEPSLANADTSTKGDTQSAITALVDQHHRKVQLGQLALAHGARGPRHHRDREHGVDRALLGQKKAIKSGTRRVASRNARLGVNQAVPTDHVGPIVYKKEPQEVRVETSSEESQLPFINFISKAVHAVVERPTEAARSISIPRVAHHHEQKENVDSTIGPGAASYAQDMTSDTDSGSLTAVGRSRSSTVIRVGTGNVATVCVEGDGGTGNVATVPVEGDGGTGEKESTMEPAV